MRCAMSSLTHALRRNLRARQSCSINAISLPKHTKYHAVDAELLSVPAISLQQEHMSRTAQNEEQEEDSIDRDVRDDRGHLAQSL